jgi:DNA-binding transcriptional MerR regulator
VTTSTELLEPREVVSRTGLSIDTLRYYEREGLIGPIARRSGRRGYSERDVMWIGLITCLRDAGLGISDLKKFTTLLRSEAGAQDRLDFLRQRRVELVEHVRATEAAIAVLDDKIRHYSSA